MNTVITSLIVAVGRNGVIGRDGQLPWRLSSDLKTFRRLTLGKPVVMGRKTFQSIGRPLDQRDNIVVSRDPAFEPQGVTVLPDIAEAMILARALARTSGVDEVMVIGGAALFEAALPEAHRIYLTEVDAAPEGDVYFPALDPSAWREVKREDLPKGPRDEHHAILRVLERIEA